jgi:hypothetical protein
MIEWFVNLRILLFIYIIFLNIKLNEAVRCFYCDSPGTNIGPQLWLHTDPCTKRRQVNCNLPNQMCVVIRLSHERLNFTVSGCSEDQFEGKILRNIKY